MAKPDEPSIDPLEQLKSEHRSLKVEMDYFFDITEEIEYSSGPCVVVLFKELHEKVLAFTDKLNAHSKREEEGLFPMMARHLGENDTTIESMEQEHEKAEGHLEDFLTEAKQFDSNFDEAEAQAITIYAVQAYTTLTQHFAKEEKILFPLAENVLTDREKGELAKLF